ncbi:hypothetical protein E4191_16535 (plasmid) [Paracoccus liaowanqingii]|uniref:Uncharacterized protein n=1 Tax=Paracoccus liaowanqingii TaxID=2560053 RepID=A0A4Y5SQI4_9RHOB|nr:hypothetical protein [Paracoccus liaowanqingii]QDA35772.1 hypothetical protein E4191_16535 [Paracoccus liaowanqingii]
MKPGIIVLMALLGSPVWAQQELKSINNTVADIGDDLNATAYMSSRCAGLFDGVIAYGGQNMAENVVEQYRQDSVDLTIGTILIRMRQAEGWGLPAKDLNGEMENSLGETVRFSDMYEARFSTNYQLTGTMMERDQVAIDDLDLCDEIAPRMRSLVINMLGEAAN